LEEYRLIGRIVKVEGECWAGHRVGEEFDLTLYSGREKKTFRVPNICGFFYDVIFPYLLALQSGGVFPWVENKDLCTVSCPDNRKVIMEIKRVKAKNDL